MVVVGVLGRRSVVVVGSWIGGSVVDGGGAAARSSVVVGSWIGGSVVDGGGGGSVVVVGGSVGRREARSWPGARSSGTVVGATVVGGSVVGATVRGRLGVGGLCRRGGSEEGSGDGDQHKSPPLGAVSAGHGFTILPSSLVVLTQPRSVTERVHGHYAWWREPLFVAGLPAPEGVPYHASMARTELLIGGQWVEGRADEPLAVHSPSSGEHLADVSVATTEDVDATVAAAREAQVVLEAMPPFERAELLHKTADLLDERAEDLARQLTSEQGKPIATEARGEIEESAEIFRWAAEEVKRLETPVLPGADPNKKVLTFRRANGVYACITPWNFPMNIPAELLAPGLGGGNAVILKPSEFTPLTGAALVEACLDAGFPPGAISVLQGGGDVGGALVGHDGVDAIAFVGSMETGRPHRPHRRAQAHADRGLGQRPPDRLRRRRPRGRGRGRRLRGRVRLRPVLRRHRAAAGPGVGPRRAARAARWPGPASACSATRTTRPPRSARSTTSRWPRRWTPHLADAADRGYEVLAGRRAGPAAGRPTSTTR